MSQYQNECVVASYRFVDWWHAAKSVRVAVGDVVDAGRVVATAKSFSQIVIIVAYVNVSTSVGTLSSERGICVPSDSDDCATLQPVVYFGCALASNRQVSYR